MGKAQELGFMGKAQELGFSDLGFRDITPNDGGSNGQACSSFLGLGTPRTSPANFWKPPHHPGVSLHEP